MTNVTVEINSILKCIELRKMLRNYKIKDHWRAYTIEYFYFFWSYLLFNFYIVIIKYYELMFVKIFVIPLDTAASVFRK